MVPNSMPHSPLHVLWTPCRVGAMPALPAPLESLLWPYLTCFDLLRLGLHSRGRPHSFLWTLLPSKDSLGMVLPLATESQNQPFKTCSKLDLQLAQTTIDCPEAPGLPSPVLFYQHSRHW